MRENCTYGLTRGSRRKTAKSVLRVVEDRAGVPDEGRTALLNKHGSNKQNEDWHGSERRGKSAAFLTRFSAAKVFYNLRLDLRIEHLPILRGYGSGRRGEDNECDVAKWCGVEASVRGGGQMRRAMRSLSFRWS